MTNKLIKKLFPIDEEEKIELNIEQNIEDDNTSIDIFEKEFEVEKKVDVKPSKSFSNGSMPQVFTPKNYDEVEKIALEIINRKSLIVSLENFTNNEETKRLATRFIDFLAGVCFTQNIEIKRINSTTFMFTPRG